MDRALQKYAYYCQMDTLWPLTRGACVLLASFLLITSALRAQEAPKEAPQEAIPTEIINGFKVGNSRMLRKWCATRTLININGKASFYRSKAAHRLLKNFFKKNPPLGFDFLHQGVSESDKKTKRTLLYYIATYRSYTDYSMYILVKRTPRGHSIQRISFDEK